jgi:hypothetical protein
VLKPMTLANMRANGTRSVDVECSACHHHATMNVDQLDGAVPVPDVALPYSSRHERVSQAECVCVASPSIRADALR